MYGDNPLCIDSLNSFHISSRVWVEHRLKSLPLD
jgi:hypothetical protein